MKPHSRLVAIRAALFLLGLPIAAIADPVDNWCAPYVSRTRGGLHKFIIRKDGSEVKVHAFASGFPDDLDWGETKAEVYTATGGLPRFIAHFSTEKAKSMLIVTPNTGGGSPQSGGLVVGDLYVKYTDDRPQECISDLFDTPRGPASSPVVGLGVPHVGGGGEGVRGNPDANSNPRGGPSASAHADVDSGPYMADLQRRIKRAWFPPKGLEDKRVIVQFKIHRGGELSNLRLDHSSGLAIADQAALKAVETAAPLRPLPPGAPDDVDIQFTFDASVYGGGGHGVFRSF